jgi:hypothetical protein
MYLDYYLLLYIDVKLGILLWEKTKQLKSGNQELRVFEPKSDRIRENGYNHIRTLSNFSPRFVLNNSVTSDSLIVTIGIAVKIRTRVISESVSDPLRCIVMEAELENESENAVAFLLDQRELGKYGMFLLQM